MTERPHDLPDFDAPPVVEVAVGLQFEPLRGLHQAHVGLFWNEIRDRYPKTKDHGRIETQIEALDDDGPRPAFALEMLSSPPPHRSWFLNDSEDQLVQIQDDRVIHNWRHRGRDYPRFEVLRDEFFQVLDTFRSVIEASELGSIEGRQIEVTYVNWVPDQALSDFMRPCGVATLTTPGIDGAPVAQSWRARYAVHSDGRPVGVLRAEAKPGQRRSAADVQNGHTLTLTYLGPVKAADDTTIEAQADRGRNIIVRSFVDLTEEHMHSTKTWGRTQ